MFLLDLEPKGIATDGPIDKLGDVMKRFHWSRLFESVFHFHENLLGKVSDVGLCSTPIPHEYETDPILERRSIQVQDKVFSYKI